MKRAALVLAISYGAACAVLVTFGIFASAGTGRAAHEIEEG